MSNDDMDWLKKEEPKKHFYEMKERYYCGPFWFPRFLIRTLSKDFNLACQVHDENYMRQNLTRAQADRMFLEMMLENNPAKKKEAYTFYFLVRGYGITSWFIIRPWHNVKAGGRRTRRVITAPFRWVRRRL